MILDLSVMHGCWNRFAIVDEDAVSVADFQKGALVRAVAERLDVHGVLFLTASRGLRMRIFDRDGTEAAMCGNGIRCAARYFHDRGRARGAAFAIATRDGVKAVWLERGGVTVDMGPAREYRRLPPIGTSPSPGFRILCS
jgi:diaminopimelate epimerase